MPTSGPLKARWKTDGKELPANYLPGDFVATDAIDITVEETAMSVDMEPGSTDKQPYGLPISAKLAIALIADFQHMIRPGGGTSEEDELKQLLLKSSAITIDKNGLLKTLSQPGCEGIRFYLCKKTVAKTDGSKESLASLVTVGVDSAGKDLHYNYVEGTLSDGLVAATLANTSLVSEFASPPPSGGTLTEEGIQDKLVLLDYALEQVQNIRNNNA
jgi:hypothetical protein